MKRLLNRISNMMADAALLEMGVSVAQRIASAEKVRETFEEHFIEVAFAEENDFDEIHEAILSEHRLACFA